MMRRSFTMVELLVVMSIVALIIGAGVSMSSRNSKTQTVNAAWEDTMEALRQAKSYAAFSKINCDVCGGADKICNTADDLGADGVNNTSDDLDRLGGWRFSVNSGGGSYTLDGLCGPSNTSFDARTVVLPSGVTISPVPAPITFLPFGQGTNLVSTATISMSGFNTAQSISVTAGGLITAGVAPSVTPTSGAAPTNTPLPAPSPTATPAVVPTATRTPTPVPPTVTPAATPTVAPTPIPVTLLAVADTYVRSDAATTSYGTATKVRSVYLAVAESSSAYVRFNISSLAGKTVTNAKLRLYVTNASINTFAIRQVSDVSWTESMTYNTRPAMGSVESSIVNPATLSVWVEADVTGWIQNQVSAGATLASLGMDSAAGGDGFEVSSREGTNPPQLVVSAN